MSAIFPLPVCLTYWSRKYTTRVDPHVDNSHLVWSCDLVTLTFDLLALSSWRAWRVMGDQPLKTLSLSVLELLVITFPVGYHWKCVRATGYAPNHVTGEHWVEDHYIFLESPIPICLRIIDFHRRHYNTLALLCECVITVPTIIGIWQLHLKTVGGLRFCNTVYMYVIKSKQVQEAQLSPSDRAMPLISSNLANYHATVQKLLIRQVLTKRWYEVGGLVGGNVSWTNQRRSSCVYHLYTDDLLWRNFVKSTIYL